MLLGTSGLTSSSVTGLGAAATAPGAVRRGGGGGLPQAAARRAAQNPGRVKTPLEKWSLDQLRLSMTVTGTATPLAMVEDPDHRGWPVRLGDFIGQNGGKVTGIHRDEMVITETITDHSTGRVYPQNVKLQVPVTREEEKDFKALQEGEHMGVAKGDQ